MADHGHSHGAHGHAHAHGHSHGHSHSTEMPQQNPGESLHDFNVRFFNAKAAVYDQLNGVQDVAQQTANIFRDILPLNKETVVLDFACGTGNLSVLLSPYVKSIQGIDVTQGMVDTYNEKAVSLPDKNIHAKVANITEPTDLKPLQSTKYDLIFTQLALHHIPNAEEIVSLLATLLKETGKLVLVDFENTKDGQGFHESHGHVAHQHGFTRGEVEGWFGKANLKVEEFKSRAVTLTKQHVEEGNKALGGSAESKSFPIFVAVGSK